MSKFYKIFFFLVFTGLSTLIYAAAEGGAHEFELLMGSARSVPHLSASFDRDRAMKEMAIKNMNTLLYFISSRGSAVKVDEFLEVLKQRLEREQGYLQQLSEALKPLSAGVQATWSLKTHKMGEAVTDLLTDRFLTASNLSKLFSGTHLFDITLSAKTYPAVLGKGFWGTIEGTRYELFLLAVTSQLMANRTASQVLVCTDIDIDRTPIAHIVPLPSEAVHALNPLSLFFVSDYTHDPLRLGFFQTHTGFLFGGHRNIDETGGLEPRYPYGKEFGPEDCSSSVGKICNYLHVIATLYQWLFYESHKNAENYEAILAQVTGEQAADIRTKVAQLGKHFIPVPLEDRRVGDVFGYRVTEEGKPLGVGGHTGIYVGDSSTGIPVLWGPNRGLPQTQVDGFGLEERPIQHHFSLFVMRPKSVA